MKRLTLTERIQPDFDGFRTELFVNLIRNDTATDRQTDGRIVASLCPPYYRVGNNIIWHGRYTSLFVGQLRICNGPRTKVSKLIFTSHDCANYKVPEREFLKKEFENSVIWWCGPTRHDNKNLVKIGLVVFELCERSHRKHTYLLYYFSPFCYIYPRSSCTETFCTVCCTKIYINLKTCAIHITEIVVYIMCLYCRLCVCHSLD